MQRLLQKYPWGIFWDILKLLDAHSCLPAVIAPQQRWQKGTCASERPQAPPSATAQSHLCWALQRATAGTGGPEARARAPSRSSTAALIEKKWHEGTGGIFKSAQQPPAHVDLHISIGAPRGSTYPSVHPGDRDNGWRNIKSADGRVRTIIF